MSAETPETDHDDTEAIRALLAEHEFVGQIMTWWDPIRQCYLRQWVCPCGELFTGALNEVAAARGVHRAQVLAAYVARKVEAVRADLAEMTREARLSRESTEKAVSRAEQAERERDSLAAEVNSLTDDWDEEHARAEKAEQQRDEARAVIERVTAQADEVPADAFWKASVAGTVERDRGGYYGRGFRDGYGRAQAQLRAALAPVTEPASDRPLTLDEHLAEIERRIEARRERVQRGGPFRVMTDALSIVREYRESL